MRALRRAAALASLMRASLALDLALARIAGLPRAARLRFLADKYRALAGLVRGRSAVVRVRHVPMTVGSLSDLGTLQSAVVDVAEAIECDGVGGDGRPVVDVGANIGQFAAAVSAMRPGTEVISLEPDPAVYERLVANMRDLPEVTCLNLGAGARAAVLPFHRGPLTVTSSFVAGPGTTEIIDVPVVPLDDLTEGLRRIGLLKIDVEGFECDVARGAIGTLARSDAVLVEMSLRRAGSDGNLVLLDLIHRAMGDASIRAVGRPLRDGDGVAVCRDVLICAGEGAGGPGTLPG